jgi:hypothetical protein
MCCDWYCDGWSYRPRGHLKGNFEEVCPAMLRTNKQIYNEMVVEWYGSARYGGVIDTALYHSGLEFLNNALRQPHVNSNYRFVQRLDVSITLYDLDPTSVQHAKLVTAMERARLFLPSTGPTNLREVRLVVKIDHQFLWSYHGHREDFPALLNSHLDPLCKIFQGNVQVVVSVEFPPLKYHHLRPVTRDEWRLIEYSSLASKTQRLLEDALAG